MSTMHIPPMQKMEAMERFPDEPLRGPITFVQHFEKLTFSKDEKKSAGVFLRNHSGYWMAYRFRCPSKTNYTVKPCYRGLLPPHDTLSLEVASIPEGSDSNDLLLEVATVPRTNQVRKTVESATIWSQAEQQQITQIILPCSISTASAEKPDPAIISLSGPQRSLGERLGRVMDRIKRENLIYDLLLILAVILAGGVFLGGQMAHDNSYSGGNGKNSSSKSK